MDRNNGLRKKNSDEIKFSIITVVYNNSDGLERTIASIVNQERSNLELIVIDGGSDDGTIEVIKQYESVIDYWVSEPDKGIYDAMNKGTQRANGNWILYLNGGDTFYSHTTLQEVVPYLDDSVALCYGDTYVDDSFIKKEKLINNFGLIKMVCHQSIFFSNEHLRELDRTYDTNLPTSSDFDLIMRLLSKNKNNFSKKIPIIVSRYEKGGFSDQNIKSRDEENMAIIKNRLYFNKRLFLVNVFFYKCFCLVRSFHKIKSTWI